ncbi:MAG: type IV toxin-antitoxin system AbiEi family antitoxin domain-containing protein [Coriobacteriales bacterium]|jgi:predicted transcriptional regulator of viral defense system|nr:type IV toxin-antitoxin system AbiEi family antitoxin domain-containing protein [Coriobacteriales bacterium]
MNETHTYLDYLREIAIDQYGFVTTEQALEAGVPHSQLSKMVSRQRLERVAHGVYRVPLVPYSEYTRFMQALLWTGAPEAVLSHDTALDIYGVSDINPTLIHVTVAKSRRIRRSGGQGYAVHYQDLKPDQLFWWEGMRIVTLSVAIEQCINSGVPRYLIRQAIERGSKSNRAVAQEKERLFNLMEARDDPS